MASLALAAAVVFLFILFVGPITYVLAKLGFPSIIIWPLGAFCIVSGIWFSITLPHIFYIGLIPVYFGYISVSRTNKKQTQA
jgi:hypothetical protein